MSSSRPIPIALVTGGYSSERTIALRSAANVRENLKKNPRYKLYTIDITHTRWICRYQDKNIAVDKNDFSVRASANKKIRFALALIIMHGTPGEDGKLQGYLDMLRIPYIACSQVVSAVTSNKKYALALASSVGVTTAPSLLVFKHTKNITRKVQEKLNSPLFVKPNSGGSSLGMSKIDTLAQLPSALKKAFEEDEQVLIEEAITGREFTIGVWRHGGKTRALPCTEVIAPKDRTFFDYTAKYSGKTEEITPAHISDHLQQHIEQTAIYIYDSFACTGIVRMDFIYHTRTKKLFFLEINTLPGQTHQSFIPQQLAAAQTTLAHAYETLIEEKLEEIAYKK